MWNTTVKIRSLFQPSEKRGNVQPIWAVGLLVFALMFITLYFAATSGYLDSVVGELNSVLDVFSGKASKGGG